MDLKDYQDRIRETYLARDQKRGIHKTFIWFAEEVGELARSLRTGKGIDAEFADVLAWLLSLANLAKIDLDKAMTGYRSGCPKCRKKPCQCPEDRWP